MLGAFGKRTRLKQISPNNQKEKYLMMASCSFLFPCALFFFLVHIALFFCFLSFSTVISLGLLYERIVYIPPSSCSGYLFGYSTAVAALFVHRFRHPLPDYAHHQRVPLLGHDLLLFQDRSHRKRAQHHRRV